MVDRAKRPLRGWDKVSAREMGEGSLSPTARCPRAEKGLGPNADLLESRTYRGRCEGEAATRRRAWTAINGDPMVA